MVTGASRGIGKAIAVRLAQEGYDVALTARTVREGEAREHSSTLKKSDTRPLPGSLQSTAALVEESGRSALLVPADLLDRSTLEEAVAAVLDRWGRIDVLVNNGRYIGPGHMDLLLDTPLELLDAHLQANVMSPILLIKLVAPRMLEQGEGTIVNVTSAVAYRDPPAPAGRGGWGLGYAMSKGAFHRIAGIVAAELGDQGIRAYNVQPGFVATERIAMDMGEFGFDASTGAPPEVVAAVVAWLLSGGSGVANGATVEAQEVSAEQRLLPGWPA
jgi:NAD(P)-dependent dehydrogenase (short-subunit alcohol dehydrogenase family)